MFSDAKARIYDLRSNYAVTNINKWKYVGPEWFDKLLYLSRTMGHTTIKATAYYFIITWYLFLPTNLMN